jgi:hypothetical protein
VKQDALCCLKIKHKPRLVALRVNIHTTPERTAERGSVDPFAIDFWELGYEFLSGKICL